MLLLLYINDELVGTEPLNLAPLKDDGERQGYIQEAMNLLLEKWSDVLDKPGAEPRFVLKGDIKDP